MLFNSWGFLLFFPAVTLVYYLLPKKLRWIWLLVASYAFYMLAQPVYGLLLLSVTGLTYVSGLLLARFLEKKNGSGTKGSMLPGKLAVALSFAGCLGMLAFFKYFDFLTDNLLAVAGRLGISLESPALSVLLPMGVSFYTFQALGYVMDVYREKIAAERNFFRYALFVSFFPTLVAGPIQRAPELLKQLQKPLGARYDQACKGLMLMLWGYFQKLVIADRAAILVNTVFSEYGRYAGFTIVFAVALFAIQIYCDFAGYSAIAVGAAQTLGFELKGNFRQPYFSVSISDFWRRWHISLSSWFRDYLYIPLGGSRCSEIRKYGNLLLTFLVSGLWHGASWNYVLWGGLNGGMLVAAQLKNKALQAMGRSLQTAEPPIQKETLSARLLRSAVVCLLVGFTWIFFRAPSARTGFAILAQVFRSFNPWIFFDGTLTRLGLTGAELGWLAAAVAALLCVDLLHENGYKLREGLLRQQLWFRFLIYLLGIFGIIVLGVYGPNADAGAFIYAQF